MNQDKLWDAFQNEPSLRRAFKATPRFRRLISLLRSGEQVLNVGVGDGGFERMATQVGIVISCLDPSRKSIEALQATLCLGDRARQGYSDAIPFPDACFDAVVMSEVIEHLDDGQIERTLCEVARVLRPQGRFIGTVPADEDLSAAHVVCPRCGEHFHRWGHAQSFSRQRLMNFLLSQFSDVSVRRTYYPEWTNLNWKGKIASTAKRTLLALGIRGADETLLFQARRS